MEYALSQIRRLPIRRLPRSTSFLPSGPPPWLPPWKPAPPPSTTAASHLRIQRIGAPTRRPPRHVCGSTGSKAPLLPRTLSFDGGQPRQLNGPLPQWWRHEASAVCAVCGCSAAGAYLQFASVAARWIHSDLCHRPSRAGSARRRANIARPTSHPTHVGEQGGEGQHHARASSHPHPSSASDFRRR